MYNKEQYTIFIAARDTPWGERFTRDLTAQLMALGLKINLYGKFRYAYAAVLDQGERVFEEVSSSTAEKVTWSGLVGKVTVNLESRGFEVAPSKAKIELNGQDYSVSLRGLNVVVYDKVIADVVDSVNFDTWTDVLTCTRPSVLSRDLAKWHAEHPEVGLLCFNKPDFPTTNLTPNEQFIVENYGYYLSNEDRRNEEEIQILNALPVRPGDIVLCDWGFSDGVPFLDLKREGQRPHNYGEIFFDIGPSSGHLTENGYRLTAEKIFERLEASGLLHELSNTSCERRQAIPLNGLELSEYKSTLRNFYDRHYSVGACVMNCNPFTLGHRYLIEQALLQCAHLVVFVVEEDRSCFPFKDRIQLVKEGLSDLRNVTVLPSGKFILSSLTFSEYFNKSELQNRTVDSSQDVYLFAKEIAPCLHITKRFVGSEPFDTVTKQYNLEMKKIFPLYGIETIEIERLVQPDQKALYADDA